jgi:CheY-like chemotaxis protein
MLKNVLIVENDAALTRTMRDALTAKRFQVEDTNDGKGCQELIRRKKPDLVVLMVDLAAGQNGYIICGKLKKDDDLKSTPVVIVGNPEGFQNHKKLKTRADDYLDKRDAAAITERAGALIGFPDLPSESFDGDVSLSDLLVEEGDASDGQLETSSGQEDVVSGDADLQMVDSVFGSDAAPADIVDEPDASERTVIAQPHTSVPSPGPSVSRVSGADAQELRDLRAKVSELTGSLEDAHARASEFETKARELESDLDRKQAELDAASSRSSGGTKADKEVFTLREAGNKKDKEILRLKSELNEKDKELIELHEKETSFDQQLADTATEQARREAQVKTLTSKVDQLTSERKKVDQQLVTAREDARGANSKLQALQADFDQAQAEFTSAQSELDLMRSANNDLNTRLQETDSELLNIKEMLETRNRELEEAKGQLSTQAQAFADEMSGLRSRVTELHPPLQSHSQRRETARKDQDRALVRVTTAGATG